MAATITAYLLILVYFTTDKRFRPDKNAQRLTLADSDRRSTSYLVLSFGVSIIFLLLAPLVNHFRIGQRLTGGFLSWLGVILMLLGIGLRAWAARALGRFYTRTLLTAADHRIVQEGPYRTVRHPGYAGSLLVWIGAGLASGNWIAFIFVSLVCCAGYLYRIRSEEAMLVSRFGGDYAEYMRRTKRLIPLLF